MEAMNACVGGKIARVASERGPRMPPSPLRVERAQRASGWIADLDADVNPEKMLMETVSSEDDASRTDREVLVPWLKFLWESYRAVLETLKNNNKLEHAYHGTCAQAFKFCVEYKRTSEFRRLCEILRNHIQSQTKCAVGAPHPNPSPNPSPNPNPNPNQVGRPSRVPGALGPATDSRVDGARNPRAHELVGTNPNSHPNPNPRFQPSVLGSNPRF